MSVGEGWVSFNELGRFMGIDTVCMAWHVGVGPRFSPTWYACAKDLDNTDRQQKIREHPGMFG